MRAGGKKFKEVSQWSMHMMYRLLSCCFSPERTVHPNESFDVPTASLGHKSGHIYMIREREFLKTNENIYKIGKTINIKGRMPAYPKNSRLYICFFCSTDIDVVEKHMIALFDRRFVKRVDIGAEYYEGDVLEMIRALVAYPLSQPY